MNIVEIAPSFQLVRTVYLPDSFFNYYSCFHLTPKNTWIIRLFNFYY